MSNIEWKLVPVEPTEEMVMALANRIIATSRGGIMGVKGAYSAALAASPVPPAQAPVETVDQLGALHNAIMNISALVPTGFGTNESMAFKEGHRRARHAAAELVAALAAAPTPPDRDQIYDEDLVSVPRGLIGAACYVIRRSEPDSELLKKLRVITFAAPVAQPAAPVADLTDAQKAAHELLAALKAVVECQKHTYGRGIDLHLEMIDIAKQAKAAIALATGSQS